MTKPSYLEVLLRGIYPICSDCEESKWGVRCNQCNIYFCFDCQYQDTFSSDVRCNECLC